MIPVFFFIKSQYISVRLLSLFEEFTLDIEIESSLSAGIKSLNPFSSKKSERDVFIFLI